MIVVRNTKRSLEAKYSTTTVHKLQVMAILVVVYCYLDWDYCSNSSTSSIFELILALFRPPSERNPTAPTVFYNEEKSSPF